MGMQLQTGSAAVRGEFASSAISPSSRETTTSRESFSWSATSPTNSAIYWASCDDTISDSTDGDRSAD